MSINFHFNFKSFVRKERYQVDKKIPKNMGIEEEDT